MGYEKIPGLPPCMYIVRVNDDTICPCLFHFSSDTIPEAPTPPPDGNCPGGWVKYGSHCYFASESSEPGTWDDGEYTCATMFGSHLASVHSHDENSFLQEQATLTWGRASVWLGMDRDENGECILYMGRFLERERV